MKKIKTNAVCYFIAASLILTITSCGKNGYSSDSQKPLSKTYYALGTINTITIYDKVPNADKIFDEIFKRLSEIETRMTINSPGSEVDDINLNSGVKYTKVSPDTFYVIKKGKAYSDISKGGFDISVGPLVKLWNIGTSKARVPLQQEIDTALKLINYNYILLRESDNEVMLKDKGMMIDLGGIAKGYAADEAAAILTKHGIKNAIVNLGGNVLAIGENPDGKKPWIIGIQNPQAPRGKHIGIVSIINKTVVTSGIYERYFIQNGIHYHHILDPFKGYPVDNNLSSATIITEKSIDGDALSTSVFYMGIEKGLEYAKTRKDIEIIFITKDKKVYITPGLKKNFKIVDTDFELED